MLNDDYVLKDYMLNGKTLNDKVFDLLKKQVKPIILPIIFDLIKL